MKFRYTNRSLIWNVVSVAVLLLATLSPKYGTAQALWDDAQLVPASKMADGTWVSCESAGQSIKIVGKTIRCVIARAALSDVDKGPAVVMDAPAIARIHGKPASGKELDFVGMLPAILPGANSNLVSKEVAWAVVRFR